MFVFGCAGREDVIKTRSFRTIFERIFYPSPALLSAPLNGVAPFHASAPHLAPTTPAIVVTFDGLMDVVELCTVLLSFASCLVVFSLFSFVSRPFCFVTLDPSFPVSKDRELQGKWSNKKTPPHKQQQKTTQHLLQDTGVSILWNTVEKLKQVFPLYTVARPVGRFWARSR